jgi:hypothetical protein
MWELVEAELMPYNEGRMCIVAMRDDATPPESRNASHTKGRLRDPGGPVGSVGLIAGGGTKQGKTGVSCRAEAGSRTGLYYR